MGQYTNLDHVLQYDQPDQTYPQAPRPNDPYPPQQEILEKSQHSIERRQGKEWLGLLVKK